MKLSILNLTKSNNFQKIEEKIHNLRRVAFVDDPLINVSKGNKKKQHHKWQILDLIV